LLRVAKVLIDVKAAGNSYDKIVKRYASSSITYVYLT